MRGREALCLVSGAKSVWVSRRTSSGSSQEGIADDDDSRGKAALLYSDRAHGARIGRRRTQAWCPLAICVFLELDAQRKTWEQSRLLRLRSLRLTTHMRAELDLWLD